MQLAALCLLWDLSLAVLSQSKFPEVSGLMPSYFGYGSYLPCTSGLFTVLLSKTTLGETACFPPFQHCLVLGYQGFENKGYSCYQHITGTLEIQNESESTFSFKFDSLQAKRYNSMQVNGKEQLFRGMLLEQNGHAAALFLAKIWKVNSFPILQRRKRAHFVLACMYLYARECAWSISRVVLQVDIPNDLV